MVSMIFPVLFINFKTYSEATGQKALDLARKAESAANSLNAGICLVVQAIDLRLITSSVSLPVFAQHIDPIIFGSNTGRILPEAVKQSGAIGTVLNHAECKQSNEFLSEAVKRAKEIGLKVMLCAESLERARKLASFSPDFLAFEPPELIGGEISVSTAKPELISEVVKAVKKINPKIKVITGAGVKNSADVRKAIELGTQGVFVASGIVKAKNQLQAIKELVAGFK